MPEGIKKYGRRLSLVGVGLALTAVGLIPSSLHAAPDVSPATFTEVSSGVALIRTYRCNGKALGQGTGFLVGATVVMTARHVVKGACRIRVRLDGRNFNGTRWVSWYGAGTSVSAADLSTIKLDRDATDAYVFRVRSSRVPVGTNLGMIGYPLGNRLSLNQGKIIQRGKVDGAPVIAVRMLGAEGASGSPFIDDKGRVVGILQIGLGSKDVLGQRTAGVLVGLDLVRWWGPRARLDLCRAYPKGGIAGCPGAPPPPTPAPPPPAACSNGRDDDGDGRIDYPSDPGCSDPSDTNETDPTVGVAIGSYRGQTQTGNFVFFSVTPSRAINGWRVNDIRRTCTPAGGYIYGAVDLGSGSNLPIDATGRFSMQVSYDSTITWDNGDVTPAKAFLRISGIVQGSSASGTVLSTFEFDRGGRYTCSNGDETWSASLVP